MVGCASLRCYRGSSHAFILFLDLSLDRFDFILFFFNHLSVNLNLILNVFGVRGLRLADCRWLRLGPGG